MSQPANLAPIPLVDLQTQSRALKEEVLRRMGDVMDGARYILGQEVQEFEELFAAYCGTDHCIGMANGTEAIHMALRALDIGPGDEVITAGNSFAATAFAIAHAGANAVFVDIDPADFNIDVSQIENAITDKTKAIIPVHLFGQPARMREILAIARRHGLRVIEDAAQAHGAELEGQRCGSFGDIGCFSFYPGKNLGAFGDGGATVTNDPKLAEKLRLLRNYGQRVKNRHDLLAFNSRLDTIQACVLLAKMKHIENWTEQRRTVAQWYREDLADTNVLLPQEHDDVRHVYHLFVIRTPHREPLMAALAEKGIAAGIHYPNPLCTAQPFEDSPTIPMGLPVCKLAADEIVSLPMYPEMTRDQVSRVADAVAAFVTQPKECASELV
ncbi:DegT/DnrJ/EryC1/StrS family aminotransferase [Novipirellula artificiosorum]|uniref:dTDP-3-amino-3,6-dideoxy-alpha-D-galactopyranose transaminase n=1 Tax=Novipirellula artificiosorum TaxID=2528016 RepID=A0A5C6DJ38_9BACT|nr:DegT/DnrJ/EryC1/StrS family aminotransferase [Novipirellula artificiosorum]TWU34936.1 dTDP-3-amino-3,6-dideoxy-alpha-D-galactopyranose transaminase [Novipirellula artificiosorum]